VINYHVRTQVATESFQIGVGEFIMDKNLAYVKPALIRDKKNANSDNTA